MNHRELVSHPSGTCIISQWDTDISMGHAPHPNGTCIPSHWEHITSQWDTQMSQWDVHYDPLGHTDVPMGCALCPWWDMQMSQWDVHHVPLGHADIPARHRYVPRDKQTSQWDVLAG